MPFDFLKRKKGPETAPSGAPDPAVKAEAGIAFDGLTEDWRLVGRMLVEGRLSDALNKREPIDIADVRWAPIDGSEPMAPAPGLKTVDPYDLVIVLAGEDTLPDASDDARAAHRVHKVSYEVALEVPPYRVIGTVLLYPGSEPDSLLNRSSEMFVPVIDAIGDDGRPDGQRRSRGGDPRQPGVPARGRAGRREDGRASREAAGRLDGRGQLDRPRPIGDGGTARRGSLRRGRVPCATAKRKPFFTLGPSFGAAQHPVGEDVEVGR